jgi:uncharacterized protein YecE (DUF72 family)
MRYFVGTSGFGYKEWKGSFYPAKLPQKEMLSYYAQRFFSVEINNSFYRMPSAWARVFSVTAQLQEGASEAGGLPRASW